MDSLTQIILGAAVGEAALGKKVGNRAMIWGAIAGTIPDLDVIANAFMTPLDALAFHRGISHGLFPNVLLAFILGFGVYKLYQQPWHRWVAIVFWGMLGLGSIGFIIFKGEISAIGFVLFLILSAAWSFLLYKRYFRQNYSTPEAPLSGWILLFVLALVTHPILDCFTSYGTQIWQPFSDTRVAFNNISVADPLYTLPFLVCLLIAATYNKTHDTRRFWNNAGLLLSSSYMVLTIVNKTRVNTIFENTLAMEGIRYERFMTTPTILNNVLWSGIAESDDAYIYGTYSFFDKEKKFTYHKLPKDYLYLEDTLNNDLTLKRLQWFSDGYFDLKKIDHNLYEYTDLRFGSITMDDHKQENAVFKFRLKRDESGTFELLKERPQPEARDIKIVFKALWNRILGKIND